MIAFTCALVSTFYFSRYPSAVRAAISRGYRAAPCETGPAAVVIPIGIVSLCTVAHVERFYTKLFHNLLQLRVDECLY